MAYRHARAHRLTGAVSLSLTLFAALALPAKSLDAAQESGSARSPGFVTPMNGSMATDNATVLGANEKAETDQEESDSGWSLPMLGQMGSVQHVVVHQRVPGAAQVIQQKNGADVLSGSISSANSYDQAGQAIDKLLDIALERDPSTAVLDRAVHHYRKASQRAIAQAKDATDYMIPYRGFGPSSEAGDVILDEKVKLKSRASAEYARQKHIDETHGKLVSSMLQLAMGLGMEDQSRGAEVAQSGYDALAQLVGEDEATRTKQTVLDWSREAAIPESLFKKGVWDVTQKQEKHKLVVQTSLDEDPVVNEIKRRLHKYNHHSKVAMASSHVIQATLGVASMTPTFIGPAAKTALVAYVMATGGPEQVKIMKELYLDKRFESRCKVVNEEAHLALDNYEIAVLTKNKVLLACAESLLGQMVPDDTLREVVGNNLVCARKDNGA